MSLNCQYDLQFIVLIIYLILHTCTLTLVGLHVSMYTAFTERYAMYGANQACDNKCILVLLFQLVFTNGILF